MIAYLSGILHAKSEDHAVIDVGGVGYKVMIPLTTFRELPRSGEAVTLHTHLILREDDVRLYGFAQEDERELFLILISLNGVGAKMALDILSHISISQLVEAIKKEQPALLCQIPGIGKKRAERLIFDLKNNSHPLFMQSVAFAAKPSLPQSQRLKDAVEALIALGYKPLEAQQSAVEAVNALGENAELADLIKEGLKRR